ncbi:YvcK family protein [Candidatus Beckwithbacteria bacterium]|nr:YvcK family protein [Candidatus Beckwithbacteria bacterium]
MAKSNNKIVVIGGGTGTSVVISGLKQNDELDITALISVADSGGSTGRLRDEFGFQPVGDLRQSLAALAQEKEQTWIRDLLLYRFAQGNGLKGHNLGNLILTALQDMAGSTAKALEIAESIFKLEGKIYPITETNVQLVIEYEDGTILIGEDQLNPGNSDGKKIKKISLTPKAKIYQKAAESIKNADLIVVGPGDLYASILPNFAVTGIQKAFRATNAKIVYVVNLMTCFTQTCNYKASDHVKEIANYLGKNPDYVLINSGKIPAKALKLYQESNEFPVEDDLDRKNYKVISEDFVSTVAAVKQAGDALHRSLLRHNNVKLTEKLLKILKS